MVGFPWEYLAFFSGWEPSVDDFILSHDFSYHLYVNVSKLVSLPWASVVFINPSKHCSLGSLTSTSNSASYTPASFYHTGPFFYVLYLSEGATVPWLPKPENWASSLTLLPQTSFTLNSNYPTSPIDSTPKYSLAPSLYQVTVISFHLSPACLILFNSFLILHPEPPSDMKI